MSDSESNTVNTKIKSTKVDIINTDTGYASAKVSQ